MSKTLQIPASLSTDGLSIAVICQDEHRRNSAISSLRECQSCLIQELNSYPALKDVPRVLGDNYDVILIELDRDPEFAIDLVEAICAHSLATVMVFSLQVDSGMLLRCMRAGAREFLTLPFDHGTVAQALARASALRVGSHPSPKKPDGKLFVFLGAKGGAGVTTLACNFAVSLAQESQQKTLLIDLNLPLGDAAINLGIRAEYNIASAFQNCSRLDVNFLSTLLIRHNSGLFVLAAPGELAPTYVSAEAIDKLLEVARQGFDYVVVDAGSRLDFQREHLFNESATMYLVTQIGIPELRNSHRLIALLSAPGSPKLEIVINRYDPHTMGIDDEHITKALTRPAQWKVPNNYAAVRRMQTTATPFTEEDSQIARVIRQMARAACGQPAVQEKEKKNLFRGGLSLKGMLKRQEKS